MNYSIDVGDEIKGFGFNQVLDPEDVPVACLNASQIAECTSDRVFRRKLTRKILSNSKQFCKPFAVLPPYSCQLVKTMCG
jgi:hypothetical protein